ncbi:MAG: hypothetical protein LUD78_00110 [Clostridiales bacterium]|nr:hypothetical protein [Clostridiales bacterium]
MATIWQHFFMIHSLRALSDLSSSKSDSAFFVQSVPAFRQVLRFLLSNGIAVQPAAVVHSTVRPMPKGKMVRQALIYLDFFALLENPPKNMSETAKKTL